MNRITRYIAFVLSALTLTSCGIFREATVKENKPVVSGDVDKTTSVTTIPASSDIMTETETTVTEPVPAEPDPSFFLSLENLLLTPPEEGARVAFYYEDLTTGISYSYNGDTMMWSASIMKLPVVMSVLYKAEEEDIGLEDIYVYSEHDYREGSGEIIHKPVGASYTYIDLIDYMLRYSDNVALDQIRKKYGHNVHHDYVNSIGAESFAEGSGWRATAADCAILLRSTYEYIEGDCIYSDRIKFDMTNSLHTVMLVPGLSGKPIARKYGWDVEGYNDMGIVYDDHPYILVFMSNMSSGTGVVNSYISGLAREADCIHEELWRTVQ